MARTECGPGFISCRDERLGASRLALTPGMDGLFEEVEARVRVLLLPIILL